MTKHQTHPDITRMMHNRTNRAYMKKAAVAAYFNQLNSLYHEMSIWFVRITIIEKIPDKLFITDADT